MNAILFGQQEIGQLLIENGVELNARSNDGSTALITAAFFGYPEMVEALLQKGADTTIQNNMGATALISVQIPWVQAKPIYDFVGTMLQPIGVVLDYERIQNRPIAVALLQAKAVTTAASFSSSFVPEYEVETKVPSGDENTSARNQITFSIRIACTPSNLIFPRHLWQRWMTIRLRKNTLKEV